MCPEDNLLVAVQIIRNELFPDNRNHGLDGLVTRTERNDYINCYNYFYIC